MKILVCVKQVPVAESKLEIDGSGKWIAEGNLEFGVNEYDRYALEEALKIKDSQGAEVVVVSVGPARVANAIKTCLAMGADRAIHVQDDAIALADPSTIARTIHAALGDDAYDLVLAGLMGDDDNFGQLGPMLAHRLGMPHVTTAMSMELKEDGKTLRVERELEGDRRAVWELNLPALVTVQTGINEPRYATIKGIMAAKRKPLDVKSLADLGASADELGAAGAKTEIVSMSWPEKGEGAQMIEGSMDEMCTQLVQVIRERTGLL